MSNIVWDAENGWHDGPEAIVIVDNTAKIHTAQYCTQCGIGPFFYVAGRKHPELCLDCAEAVR
jgi:hypothetical protein